MFRNAYPLLFPSSCFTGSHDIHIDIRGESMLAKLLRKTIGAFNTSSHIDLQSSNWRRCLSGFINSTLFFLYTAMRVALDIILGTVFPTLPCMSHGPEACFVRKYKWKWLISNIFSHPWLTLPVFSDPKQTVTWSKLRTSRQSLGPFIALESQAWAWSGFS